MYFLLGWFCRGLVDVFFVECAVGSDIVRLIGVFHPQVFGHPLKLVFCTHLSRQRIAFFCLLRGGKMFLLVGVSVHHPCWFILPAMSLKLFRLIRVRFKR